MAAPSKGKLIVVGWDEVPGKTVTDTKLKNFIKTNSGSEPVIQLGTKQRKALLIFKKEEVVSFLRHQWKADQFWTVTELYTICETVEVKVKNLPPAADRMSVSQFFTNNNMVGVKLGSVKVPADRFQPEKGVCLLQLKSADDVKTACEKSKTFKKYRNHQLELEPFYEDIDVFTDSPTNDQKEITPVVIDNIDHWKIKFVKDYLRDDVEETFKGKCAQVKWGNDGINKIKFLFKCDHDDQIKRHSETWETDVRQKFYDIVDDVVVLNKNLSSGVWGKVRETLDDFHSDAVLLEVEADECRVIIVGQKDDPDIAKLVSDIDAIQPPKPIVSKNIEIKDKVKLRAFKDLEMHETVDGVTVEYQIEKGIIKIQGDKEIVDKSELKILGILGQINVQTSKINSRDHARILQTDLIRDQIETCKDELGKRWGYYIEGRDLVIYSTGEAILTDVENRIKSFVVENDFTLDGTFDNEDYIRRQIREVEKEYSQYAKLTFDTKNGLPAVHIVCGKNFVHKIVEELKTKVDVLLIKTEVIHISPHIVKYVQNNTMDKIKKRISESGIKIEALKSSKETKTFKVTGNAKVRKKVGSIINEEAKKVYASWKAIEEEGIHDYFKDGDGFTFLANENNNNKCEFQMATQYEMKKVNIHCITALESGQALFVGTGSLTKPPLPVDAIVNAANTELKHGAGLAADLVKEGGRSIQDDCETFIAKNGNLSPGQVYVGTSGQLPCQRIIHAVGPEWRGGNMNEDKILQTAVENIVDAMTTSEDCILRSVAIPLLSAGIFGFPRARSARIILQTIKDKLQKTLGVREVYFFDNNPDNVRTIQKQMHSLFGGKCFHLPVQNIGLGKGTMTQFAFSKMFKLERTGSRILPLPGRKNIIVKWGELRSTSAEVLVNVTQTAPIPTGKITDELKTAAGVNCDITSECQKAFKRICPDNNFPDGTMAITKAGRLPCSEIYHIKIKPYSDSNPQALSGYIKACLQEAVRQKRISIAFPTIGTEYGYPGDMVASTFIRTVGEFMKLHSSCSLTDISIVIFKTDLVNTSAFEVTIEELYSQRPNRLIADIEERMEQQLQNEGENKEKNEGKDGKETPKVTPQQRQSRPQSAAYGRRRNNPPSASEGSFTVDQNSDVNVDLQIGGIENANADAIVCTTSSFPRLNGAIANAIKTAGGPSIQAECNNCYKNYPDHGVASTTAGKLNCKRVFYVVLKDYQAGDKKQVIYDTVIKCLEQAVKERISSIAMPTFGTGGFKYPDLVASVETYKAIQDFCKTNNRSFPKLISIVMFGKAQQTCQVFFQEAAKIFTQIKAPTVTVYKTPEVQTTSKPNAGGGGGGGGVTRQWNVPKSSTSLEITYGSLEFAKADVILNTTTSYPKLNGVIPSSLCKRAGDQLQQECSAFKGNISSGMIQVTKGYNLDCKEVYHFMMPNWTDSNGEKAVVDCIDDCLQMMKRSGHKSIALPSIGTGGAKYDAKKVARGIYRAVLDFGTANSDVKCHLNLVLYPAAQIVNDIFVDELQTFAQIQKTGKPAGKVVRFGDDSGSKSDPPVDPLTYSDENIIIPTDRRDFLLLQFISDEKKKVDLAFQSIKARVVSETKEIPVDLKNENNVDDVTLITSSNSRNKKKIEEIGESYRVRVIVNIKDRKIKIKGLGDPVIQCYAGILKFLNEIRREAVAKGIGQIVYQHIEWYYTEDDGNIWVPYPKHISFQLEDAYASQVTEKEFRDADDKHYVVDFKTMEEYIKEKKEKKTTISVIRKDLTEGAIHGLPPSWQTMKETENLVEIKLLPTSQEYKEVEGNLRRTIGGFHLNHIHEIRRIQNRTLYQQYQTRKQQLETDHKNNPNVQIERTLWHGIKDYTEKSITSTGFNRGFAGATFPHVWYGLGVYFAVNSEYSVDDNYSPLGGDGFKRVYQAKVLTGLSAEVAKGYQDRFAPLLPGSGIDRYNSTCDSLASPTEFVIYHDTQAYPEYIILFK